MKLPQLQLPTTRPKGRSFVSMENAPHTVNTYDALHVIYYRDIFTRNLRYFWLHRANLLHKIPVMNL